MPLPENAGIGERMREAEAKATAECRLPWTYIGPPELPMIWDDSGDAIVNRMPDGRPYFEPEVADYIERCSAFATYALEEIDRLRGAMGKIAELAKAERFGNAYWLADRIQDLARLALAPGEERK